MLTCFEPKVHNHIEKWRTEFEDAPVHVQWDPERTIHGKKLEHRSIQVGISRHVIRELTDDWLLEIADFTAQVRKIRNLFLQGTIAEPKTNCRLSESIQFQKKSVVVWAWICNS